MQLSLQSFCGNPEILMGSPWAKRQTRVGVEKKLFSSFMRRYLDQSYF